MQWQVSTMERTLTDGALSDVVTTLHWQCTDSDGEHHGRCYGTVGLAAPGDSFTPYADITEAEAIGWCKSALGDDQVAAYEDSVNSQIDQQKNPTQAAGVPW